MSGRGLRAALGLGLPLGSVLGRRDRTGQSWPLARNGVEVGEPVPPAACPPPGSCGCTGLGRRWGRRPTSLHPPQLGALGAVRPLGLISVTLCPWLPAAVSFHPSLGLARPPRVAALPGPELAGSGQEAARPPPPPTPGGAARKPRPSGPWQGCPLAAAEAAGGLPVSGGDSVGVGPGVSRSGRGLWGAVSGHKDPQTPPANLLPGPETLPTACPAPASPQCGNPEAGLPLVSCGLQAATCRVGIPEAQTSGRGFKAVRPVAPDGPAPQVGLAGAL